MKSRNETERETAPRGKPPKNHPLVEKAKQEAMKRRMATIRHSKEYYAEWSARMRTALQVLRGGSL